MITSNIYQRVLHIRYGEKYATGFTIEIDEKQYLITCRHLFCKENDLEELLIKSEDKIQIYKGGWKNLEVRTIECTSPLIDILAFALPNNESITPRGELIPTMADVIFTQDVYFLGFPYELRADYPDINNGYPLPFVKKGIISAIGHTILYIDGHSNKGFSGGPVVYWNLTTKKLHVAGVISGYLNDVKDSKSLTTYFKENSGIIEAFTIKSIVESISGS